MDGRIGNWFNWLTTYTLLRSTDRSQLPGSDHTMRQGLAQCAGGLLSCREKHLVRG